MYLLVGEFNKFFCKLVKSIEGKKLVLTHGAQIIEVIIKKKSLVLKVDQEALRWRLLEYRSRKSYENIVPTDKCNLIGKDIGENLINHRKRNSVILSGESHMDCF